MEPVGGLRSRLIRDSLYSKLSQALGDLGWFDSGRHHLPVTLHVQPLDPTVEVTFNAIGITDGGTSSQDAELGTIFAEHINLIFIDVFAESDTLGLHLSRDIADIISGRIPSIGASRPTVDVYDYSQATPPLIFVCHSESVMVDKAHATRQPWHRFWYSVAFNLVDAYGDEDG